MSNYSDSPSMDEILGRIKKALSDRKKKIDDNTFSDSSVMNSDYGYSPKYDDEDELKSSSNVSELSFKTSKAEMENSAETDMELKDEITIKPNLQNSDSGSSVFVLSKDMKIQGMELLQNADFHLFCQNLSVIMSKDLSMAYMAPKIDTWLRNNFWDIVEMAQKK